MIVGCLIMHGMLVILSYIKPYVSANTVTSDWPMLHFKPVLCMMCVLETHTQMKGVKTVCIPNYFRHFELHADIFFQRCNEQTENMWIYTQYSSSTKCFNRGFTFSYFFLRYFLSFSLNNSFTVIYAPPVFIWMVSFLSLGAFFYCLLCRISITNPVFHLYKFKPQIYSEPIRLKRLGLLLHHSNVDVTYKSIRRIHIVNIDFTRASVWDGIFGFRWWIFLSEFPISSWGVMHHC